jgi:integrase
MIGVQREPVIQESFYPKSRTMPRTAKPHWSKSRLRWYANIGEPDEKGRRREVFAPEGIGPRDKDGADDWMKAERKRRREADKPADNSTLSVGALAQAYLQWADGKREEGKLAEAFYRGKQSHLRRFVDEFRERQAWAMTPDDMNRFTEALQREGLTPNYVHNLIATVAAMFNWAAGKGRILTTNPLKADGGFERVRVPRTGEQFAERSEAAAWLRYLWGRSKPGSVNNRYDRLLALLQRCLIATGARPGELLGMRWDDLRWRGWQTSAGHFGAKVMLEPSRWKAGAKTGNWRTIYIPPALTRALRREFNGPDRHPEVVFIHGRGKGGLGAGEPWPDSSTLAQKTRRVRRELRQKQAEIRARIEAGQDVTEQERRLEAINIHDEGSNRLDNYRWRHTAISTLLMRGEDVATTAELTGTSVAMIERTYKHLLDKHLQRAAERLAVGTRTPKQNA